MLARFGRQLYKIMVYIRDKYIPMCRGENGIDDEFHVARLASFASEFFSGTPKESRPPHVLLPHKGEAIARDTP